MKKIILIICCLWYVFAQNTSLSFDGNGDYVDCGNDNIFNFNNSFTIHAKIKIYEFNSSQGHSAVISKKPNDGWGGGFELMTGHNGTDGGIGMNYYSGTDWYYFDSSIVTDTWYDVVFTFNGNQFEFYIDGNLKITLDGNGSLGDNGVPLVFGRRAADGFYKHFFNGEIDKVSLWDTPMGIFEVQNLSNDVLMGNEEGLVGYWDFNAGEGEILYDYSENQNHGMIYGADWVGNIHGCTDEFACNYDETANWDDGSCEYSCHDNSDYSLHFDGFDDYVNCGQSEIISFDYGDLTHSIFIKLDELGGSTQQVMWNGYNPELQIEPDGKVYVYFQAGGCGVIASESNITINQWYHIILKRENGQGFLYIDGILEGTSDASNCNCNSDANLHFGIQWPEPFGGYIRDATFWDYALLENEFNILSSNLSGNETGLIGYWRFIEGVGNTVYDYSGNQNHGVIYGASWDDGNDNVHIVPNEYETIQAGIDAASDGDTVLVAAGTYYIGETSFQGKTITIMSLDGPENTFLGRIIAVNGEGEGTTLSGFTFEEIFRPVLVGSNSYLSIENCIFINNEEETINCAFGSDLSVSNVLIDGGRNGIYSAQGGCEIYIESTTIVNMWGEGIQIRDGAQLTMVNSILNNNELPIHYWTTPPVYLNLFYNNINGILLDENGELAYCEYEDEGVECNVSNNINIDPLFTNPENGDYTLQPTSPCIDAGDPESPLDPDGSSADMGAYPFYHYPFIEFISPADGETWYADSTYTIQWEGGNPDGEVVIALIDVDADLVEMDIAITPNNGSYEWVAAVDDNQLFGYGTKILYIGDTPGDDYWGYSNEFVITRLAELGDLTQDFFIDILDIVMLINIIIDYNTSGINPTEQQLELGDINQDGMLNVIDIVGLVNIVLDN